MEDTADIVGITGKPSDELVQLVSFRVGDEEFGVDIGRVREIHRMLEITRVPNVPVYVHGVVNLRGKVIPIVDLRRRFGLEQKDADKDTRIVVAELAEKVVGFVVDSVREVLRISRHVTTGPPMMMTRIERQYITGFARLEDRLLMVLELQTVIDADALVGISERPTGCIA